MTASLLNAPGHSSVLYPIKTLPMLSLSPVAPVSFSGPLELLQDIQLRFINIDIFLSHKFSSVLGQDLGPYLLVYLPLISLSGLIIITTTTLFYL